MARLAALAALMAIALFAGALAWSSGPVSVRIPFGQPISVPHFLYLGASLVIGGVAVILLFWMAGKEPESPYPSYMVAFAFLIMSLAAARAGELTYVQAAMLILFGGGALGFGYCAARRIQQGDTIEMSSQWGGLGGGLGGWRLSLATALLAITMVFAAGTVAVFLNVEREAPGKQTTAAPATSGSRETPPPEQGRGGAGKGS